MSDLLVNGKPYDVYTPEVEASGRNILSNVASKWSRLTVVASSFDLSNAELNASGRERFA